MTEPKTCFKRIDYDLSSLLNYIDIGDIGLPDIQRPFVWKNSKVRDLLDSMYRGFPVGYLLFWENMSVTEDMLSLKHIGVGCKQRNIASRLIIDGQQRLTSLYAVFKGQQVLDKNYKKRIIEIAFRPRNGEFKVADAAIKKDAEWIPNISELWISGKSSRKLVNDFIAQLNSRRSLSEDEEETIAHNLDLLFDLQKYPFTALEIASSVGEEQVADIFVRINSEGVQLSQADFILTLLSVFWDQGRSELEKFCHDARQIPEKSMGSSPYNHFIEPDPEHLLRVAIAVGFRKGKLKSVYQILRGKNLDGKEESVNESQQRTQQFDILKQAQAHVLKLTNWHQFFSCLIGAGFRSSRLISSKLTLLYTYAFYLLARIQYKISNHKLEKVIGRWFFFCTLTGRYTGSSESVMDNDLARLRDAKSATDFVRILDEVMASGLTSDFWEITFPANLENSSGYHSGQFAFIASQNRLNASVLFSHKKMSEMLDPALNTSRQQLEKHHLFPKAWLKKQGLEERRIINQIANYSLLEWPDNVDISAKSPREYVPELKERFTEQHWRNMQEMHALPENWWQMDYKDFLEKRRYLMASIVRRGFESLK
jgi:hypothetical protein